METYNDSFYTMVESTSRNSAEEVVPLVLELLSPKRMIDVGCGIGTWLSVFKEHGVEEIIGVDGDWVDLNRLKIPAENFLVANLEEPLPIEQKFDLVVSLEVAEHLYSEKAEVFLDSLEKLGSACLFSAAICQQGGVHHVNEQWPEYWIKRFQYRGYVVIDCLRKKIWNNTKVAWWYKQNLFLFVKPYCLKNYPLLQQEFINNSLQHSLIHPELFVSKCSQKGSCHSLAFSDNITRHPYPESFYREVQHTSRQSAQQVVPLVMKFIQPKTLIDVGCGLGSWLSVFREHGVEDVCGVDGEWIEQKLLEIPDHFLVANLEEPLLIDRQFDLVVSLAVAERIPIDKKDIFIDSLVKLGKVCLFSAAIPYQGGLNNCNEQWQDYWVQSFHERGFIVVDCLRKLVWNNPNVAPWYSQNMLLFVEEKFLQDYPVLQEECQRQQTSQLSIVHPTFYLARC